MNTRISPEVEIEAVGTMVALSPSAFEHWLSCRRLYLNADVLHLPGTDPGPPTGDGLLVHDLLRHLHAHGSCADQSRVTEVLEGHGCDERIRHYLEAHVRRCPAGARSLGHEQEVARFSRWPGPIFMATGRIDALWEHDGMLDARDYKTGSWVPASVGEDPKARLQAWLLAPRAAEEGLRLRIRYECLSPTALEEPEPFEPDADTLDAIGAELRGVVQAIRSERAFSGVGDPLTCRRCSYRSVCPDSAAEAE